VVGSAGGVVMWGLAYALLAAALILRVRADDAPPPEAVRPVPGEPLGLVRLHHALFAALLLGAPVEALVVPGSPRGRIAGVLLFAAGVTLYRRAGRTLGRALSPFIEPRAGAPLVRHGLYRHLRHPIYLSQALIAVGAPLTLGCRWTLGVALLALGVLVARIMREEEALARTFPEYHRYAAKTKRLVPFVF
jgi:protein-S-isoprenylcysteine O-methyltransferase Ste14